MEQSTNDAAAKGAQVKLRREECASSMGQRSNDAAVKDVEIKFKEEECVKGMGHLRGAAEILCTATTMMNRLLLHRVLDQNLIKLHSLIPISVLRRLLQPKAVYLNR